MKFLSYQVIYFFISFWLGWVCRDFFQKKELNKFSRSEKNVDSSRVSSKSVISKSVSKTASYVPEIKKKVRPSKAVVNKAARKEDTLDSFIKNLQARKFLEAFDIYHYLEESVQEVYDRKAYKIINQWLQEGSFDNSIEYCTLLTNEYPYKKRYWLLLANSYKKNAQTSKAISTLYLYRKNALDDSEYSRISKIIEENIGSYIGPLFKKNEFLKVKIFFEEIVSYYDSENAYHKMWYIKSLIKLGLHEDAFEVSESIYGYQDLKIPLQKLKKYLRFELLKKQAQENNSFIDLEKKGNHFFANIIVDSELKLKLLVDTGASKTIVNRHAVQSLLDQKGLNMKSFPTQLFQVADSRSVKAYLYQSESFQVGTLRFEKIPIFIMETNSKKSFSQGLLGMDILKYFDLDNGKLFLKRVETPNLEY